MQAVRRSTVHIRVAFHAPVHGLSVAPAHRDDGGDIGTERGGALIERNLQSGNHL